MSLPFRLKILSAIGLTIDKSELILFATPGYWIFTASILPFFVARWTCPMLAAFSDFTLNVSKIFSGSDPKYLFKDFLTNGQDRGGTENWDKLNLST